MSSDTKSETLLPDSTIVMVDGQVIAPAPPLRLTCRVEIEDVYERPLLNGEVEMSPTPIHSYVRAKTFSLYSGDTLIVSRQNFKPMPDMTSTAWAGVHLFNGEVKE